MSARNHHYIPQCYLRGFSEQQNRQSKLFVLDRERGQSFTANIRNIGSKRDFNRVEADGLDPNAFETAMARFESEIAPILYGVSKKEHLEEKKNLDYILNLMSCMTLNIPWWREKIRAFHEEAANKMMGLLLAEKGRWESNIQRMIDDGALDPSKPQSSYEEMKEFFERGEYTINLGNTYALKSAIQHQNTILKLLAMRKWAAVEACHESGFITSDKPVCLKWIDMKDYKGIFGGPGFGLAGTEVIFPVNRHLTLIGTIEDNEVYTSSVMTTAWLNSITAAFSESQIYAKDENFILLHENGLITRGGELLKNPPFRKP